MLEPIDLDQNATTALDPLVFDAMKRYWQTPGGNAESRHSGGRAARRALDEASEIIGSILGAHADEVVFTGSGTEANNLALFGIGVLSEHPGHIVTSLIEHPAVSEPLSHLESRGFRVERLLADTEGIVSARAMAACFTNATRLATLMLANNETGALQPVGEVSEYALERNIHLHTDAVQAVGRISVNFHGLGVTTLAASAHKFHGPSGVGILLVRRGFRLAPYLFGGKQQGGRRPGTVPVALAVGAATALMRWHEEEAERRKRWLSLRRRLEAGLKKPLGPERIVIHGPMEETNRLPQTLNVAFPGLEGEALILQLDLAGVYASLGSACSSGSLSASPTLLAMGIPVELARSSVRFSFGARTTESDIDIALSRVLDVVNRVARCSSTL